MKLFACVSYGSSTVATKLLSSVINTRVTSASHSIMSHRRRNALVAVFTPGPLPSLKVPVLTHAEKVKTILSYKLNNNRSEGSCDPHKNLKEEKKIYVLICSGRNLNGEVL